VEERVEAADPDVAGGDDVIDRGPQIAALGERIAE
jgi:hypothetical protein